MSCEFAGFRRHVSRNRGSDLPLVHSLLIIPSNVSMTAFRPCNVIFVAEIKKRKKKKSRAVKRQRALCRVVFIERDATVKSAPCEKRECLDSCRIEVFQFHDRQVPNDSPRWRFNSGRECSARDGRRRLNRRREL